MFRCKTIIGRRLHARTLPNHRTEAKIGCNVLNRMAGLGMPVSARIHLSYISSSMSGDRRASKPALRTVPSSSVILGGNSAVQLTIGQILQVGQLNDRALFVEGGRNFADAPNESVLAKPLGQQFDVPHPVLDRQDHRLGTHSRSVSAASSEKAFAVSRTTSN